MSDWRRAFPTDWELSKMALAEERGKMRSEYQDEYDNPQDPATKAALEDITDGHADGSHTPPEGIPREGCQECIDQGWSGPLHPLDTDFRTDNPHD
jgi:hypothetical protein